MPITAAVPYENEKLGFICRTGEFLKLVYFLGMGLNPLPFYFRPCFTLCSLNNGIGSPPRFETGK